MTVNEKAMRSASLGRAYVDVVLGNEIPVRVINTPIKKDFLRLLTSCILLKSFEILSTIRKTIIAKNIAKRLVNGPEIPLDWVLPANQTSKNKIRAGKTAAHAITSAAHFFKSSNFSEFILRPPHSSWFTRDNKTLRINLFVVWVCYGG